MYQVKSDFRANGVLGVKGQVIGKDVVDKIGKKSLEHLLAGECLEPMKAAASKGKEAPKADDKKES